MDFWNLTVRITFLSQITVGILGNVSLLFYYLVLYLRNRTLKPTDLILMHIMAANVLIILSSGVPHTMVAFTWTRFLNDFGCRLLIHIQAFGRTVSIGTTCLLSAFRAMTISPRGSCWKHHKVRAAKYIGCSVSLLWVLYMLINSIIFVYPFIQRHSKNMTRKLDFGDCSIIGSDDISDSLYAVLVVCPEVVFVMLFTWSSTSLVVILYRHKQRVQHIHSSRGSSRASPESRATQSILILVSTFLAFDTLSSILKGCIAFLYNHNWWLMTMDHLTSLCFPSSGPFILMNHYCFVPRLHFVWRRNNSIILSM
ncbi:vomeronasal type-1 receptor 4-like [Acomys russatus]|uniref:vomeronasal type-1 receptor 4-like n=1 Tax=Acomys russatus TaxID=60746 RepID=UPI0021E1D5A3|nr:vomeronasal type-1 receptor 4-like [Acomys russatus]